jgi:23S rRNA (cytosine1962-C5)-methyltransferase
MPAKVILHKGREKSLLRHHPWIFAGAIESIQGSPELGDTVEILSNRGYFLAKGAYSPNSNIRLRIWAWQPETNIDENFFYNRLRSSINFRKAIPDLSSTNAYRLVYGESDGIPGLIVDLYADTLVMQCLSAGIEHWRNAIAVMLTELTGVKAIYERSDVDVRNLEGLPIRVGSVFGDMPSGLIKIHENNLQYWVDVVNGQKTGFYLDQRRNRFMVSKYSMNLNVLDCFTYTGGFTLAALNGGASHVTAVDNAEGALGIARMNYELNGFRGENVEWIRGDVFQVLRKMRDSGRSFDLIILDPPKFAPTIAHVKKAARGYKDINLLAFKLLRPGGLLITFSCSGGIDTALFQKIISGAAEDAKVEAQILEILSQGPDHPIAIQFPESSYLKGFVIRIK